MRVELDRGAFNKAEALTDLLVLMRCFIEGLHDWVAVPETIAAARTYLQEHAPKLAETYVELARKGTVAASWSGGRPATVVKIEAADLADHIFDLCRQPAVVVVEDIGADGSFIRAICTVFRSSRLQEALSKGWLQIEHGGGSGVKKVAADVALRYRRVVRVVALMDSDRLIPGQETRKYMEADQLTAQGVVVHVLELREAENYVPNRILSMARTPSDSSRKLTLLAKLTSEQRGHFDMKQGFGRADRSPHFPPEQRSLFGRLDHQVLLGLRGGFGENLLALMERVSTNLSERDFASLGEPVVSDLRALIAKLTDVI